MCWKYQKKRGLSHECTLPSQRKSCIKNNITKGFIWWTTPPPQEGKKNVLKVSENRRLSHECNLPSQRIKGIWMLMLFFFFHSLVSVAVITWLGPLSWLKANSNFKQMFLKTTENIKFIYYIDIINSKNHFMFCKVNEQFYNDHLIIIKLTN